MFGNVGTANDQRKDVLATLDRILDGGVLGDQSRLRDLLCHLVTEELDGRGDRIKAYSIGTVVFNRSQDFDPNSDSIVRVEVNRLRQSLEHFYATDGTTAPIRIDIPKGTYRPRFTPQAGPLPQVAEGSPETAPGAGRTWVRTAAIIGTVAAVAVVVLAFLLRPPPSDGVGPNAIRIAIQHMGTPDGQSPAASLSKGMIRDLRSVLSRNPAFKVIGGETASDPQPTDFRVESGVEAFDEAFRFSIEVINGHSDALVWSRTYPLEDDNQRQDLIEHVSRELRTRLLGATKEVLDGRDPATLSAHQLFVMATWVSGPAVNALEWEQERLTLARLAVEKDPDFGPAHSVLSDKLAFLAGVDGTMNSEAALQESERSWQKAMELSPLDANVVFNVALGQWHSGHIADSARSMERVVQLDPTHALASFKALLYPYTCVVAPDNVMDAAIAFDQQLAEDDPIRWITLTWTSLLHMSRQEYDLALDAEARAAQIFQSPYTTIRHAALLNLKGRTAEAHKLIESQRRNWPNIDPAHFAEVTMPRHCKGSADADQVIRPYRDLAKAMKDTP